MDLVPYVAAAQDFLASHPGVDTAIGLFVGAIGSHPVECADLAFAVIAKTPLKAPLIRHWPAVKAWLDTVEDRLSVDVAASAADDGKAPPAAPPAVQAAAPTPVPVPANAARPQPPAA